MIATVAVVLLCLGDLAINGKRNYTRVEIVIATTPKWRRCTTNSLRRSEQQGPAFKAITTQYSIPGFRLLIIAN